MPVHLYDAGDVESAREGVKNLVNRLTQDMQSQGYYFSMQDEALPGNFFRVFVARGMSAGWNEQYDLYLDLRIGPGSPGGNVIEMASSKPETYGMPGFARHVAGSNKVDSTFDVFKDYIRTVYTVASQKGKTPQQVSWTAYQTGSLAHNYPGAREWGVEEFEQTAYPKAGGVLGPSALSGKRQYMASTVRYFVTGGVEEKQAYFDEMNRLLKSGKFKPLRGYGPEVNKWKAFVPVVAGHRIGEEGQRYAKTYSLLNWDTEEQVAFQGRDPAGQVKSLSTIYGAREVADIPFVRDQHTGKLTRLEPTLPRRGESGLREGWTLSSVIMPEELEPNIVYSKRLALVDQPDMPGATLASKDAWKTRFPETDTHLQMTTDVEAIGEEGFDEYVFGVRTMQGLRNLLNKELTFYNTQDKLVEPGSGMVGVGQYYDEEKVPGKKRKPKKLLIEASAYEKILGKMVLHIPKYYDPEHGDEFSNFPVFDEEGTSYTTDKLAEMIRQKYKGKIEVRTYSAKGGKAHDALGKETGHPAEVYLTIPTARILPVGMKPEGIKSFVAQLNKQLTFKLLGSENKDTPVDFVTQEAKVPPRVLMSSFGIMNEKTQLEFIDTFFPKNPAGIAAVKKMVMDAYRGTTKWHPGYRGGGFKVGISMDRMAEIWEKETGEATSADSLFGKAFRNILAINDPQIARDMLSKFGIGLPIDQMAPGTIYTEETKREFLRMMEDKTKKTGVDYSKDIEFVRYLPTAEERLLAKTSAFGIDDLEKTPLYEMRYRVQQGQSAMFQAGVTFTPEYSSSSGYIGPKAIQSMISNYPEMSRAMGLTKEKEPGKWAGPLYSGAYGRSGVPPSVRGWNELFYWLPFQREIMLFGNENLVLPEKTIALNEDIAQKVKEVITVVQERAVQEGMNDRDLLVNLQKALNDIDLTVFSDQFDPGTKLGNSYIFDPNSGTLIPKISSILDVEHYGRGALEGMTETYMGENYLRVLNAAVDSTFSDPGASVNTVGKARNAFYARVNSAFNPQGKRSKEIMRNILGMRLPGSRGGRYQGLTQLELGHAYASDKYIRAMLAQGGFKSHKQIERIIKYLDTGTDAYLPVLFQRFPDVSGNNVMVPVKLHSAKHLKSLGVDVPEGGPAASDLFFIGHGANRVSVGDFDGDPYLAKILPIFENAKSGRWEMEEVVANEFNRTYKSLFKTGEGIDTALEYMFGKIGIDTGEHSLDAARKNLSDYLEGLAHHRASLTKRLTESEEPRDLSEIVERAARVSGFKGGMSMSYITRTQLADIGAAAVPGGMRKRSKKIASAAYERGALTYQSYLDRLEAVQNGLTQLETALNSFGIYSPTGEPGNLSYRMNFKVTEQGKETTIEPETLRGIWPHVGGQGLLKTTYLLNMLMTRVSGLNERQKGFVSNEMLAYGFSTPGSDEEVLTALENPKEYWISTGRTPEAVDRMRPDTVNDRGLILKNLVKTGKIGFDSPYYLMFAYNAIERFAKKYPEYENDPSIQIPWLDGKMTAIRDIVKTKPYRMAKIYSSLVLSPTDKLSPADFEELKELGGSRLEALAAGIYATYKKTTGGVAKLGAAEKETVERYIEAIRIFSAEKMKMTPEIHASEMGTLGPSTKEVEEQGWKAGHKSSQFESMYKVILRTLGIERLMGEEAGEHVAFIKYDYSRFPEAIEGGRKYEKEYATAHPELFYVGNVPVGKNLQFRVGGVEVHGTPDFLGYDEKTDSLVILDTKQPAGYAGAEEEIEAAKKERRPVDPKKALTPEQAVAHTKQFRYRIQQMSYAFGLEDLAKKSTLDEWKSFMKYWGIKDEERLEKMYTAALRGQFKISLAPGRWTPDRGLEELEQIKINWGARERAEYTGFVESVEKSLFEKETFGGWAARLYGAISARHDLPYGLSGYRRGAEYIPEEFTKILKQVGIESGAMRAAGGGEFKEEIHVGEGGPEDVVIDEGGVTIVPTSQLPEAKAMRGEGRGGAGVTDIRASKRGTRIRVGKYGPEDIVVGNRSITSLSQAYGKPRFADGGKITDFPRPPDVVESGESESNEEETTTASSPANIVSQEDLRAYLDALKGQGAEGVTQEYFNILDKLIDMVGVSERVSITDLLQKQQGMLEEMAKGKVVIQMVGRSKTPDASREEIALREQLNVWNIGRQTIQKYEEDVRKVLGAKLEEAGHGDLVKHLEGVPSAKAYMSIAEDVLGKGAFLTTMKRAGLGGKRAQQVVRYGQSITRLMANIAQRGGFEAVASGLDIPPEVVDQLRNFEEYVLGREEVVPYERTPEEQAAYEAEVAGIEEKLADIGMPKLTKGQKSYRTRLRNQIMRLRTEAPSPEREAAIAEVQEKLAPYERQPLTRGQKSYKTRLENQLAELQVPPTTTRKVVPQQEFIEAVASAEALKAMGGEPEMQATKYMGASAETIKKLDDAMTSLTKSTEKYQQAQITGIGLEKAYQEVRKDELRTKAAQKMAAVETTEAALAREYPQMYEGGKFIGVAKAKALADRGVLTDAAVEAGWLTAQEREAAIKAEETAKVAEVPETRAGRIGAVARRLFGGFGLMYLRSIAGLMGTGAYTGYGERVQLEQQMAQQFLGVGGELPLTMLTEQQRVLAYQYGGSGARAIQGVRNYLMREQQPFYQAATGALAGVSAGGMMAWLTGEQGFGLDKSVGNRLALGTGIAVAAINNILGIVGAAQDVEGTSMNLAIRRARGEDVNKSAMNAILASVATGATLGGIAGAPAGGIGAVPGAIFGGVIGGVIGLTSNYQQIAESYTPEIQRQKAIIESLASRTGSIEEVLQSYDVPVEQYAYYSRLATQVQSLKKENLGITDEALAAAAAFELRRGVTLTPAEQTRFARLAQAGFNPEAVAVMATQAMGLSTFEANARINPVEYTDQYKTVMQRVSWPTTGGGITWADIPEQVPTGRKVMTPSETELGNMTKAMMAWAERRGADVASEQAQAIFGAMAQVGPAAIPEYVRRLQLRPGGTSWRSQYNTEQEWAVEYAMSYGQEYANLEARGWLKPYTQLIEVGAQSKALGLTPIKVPTVEEYAAMHPEASPEETYAAIQRYSEMAIRPSLVSQMRQQAIGTLGFVPTYAPDISGLAIQQQMQQIQYGAGFGQTLMQGGIGAQQAASLGGAFALMNPQQFYQYKQLFSGSPLQMGAWMMQNPQLAAGIMQGGTVRGLGGTALNPMFMGMTDIGPMGNLTGMNWGTTSLALPAQVAQMMAGGMPSYGAVAASSANVANMIWGDWQNRTDVSQGLIKAMISGGQFGGQAWQQLQQAQYSMAQAGVQIAQLQLQAEYMPKFWSIEDRQRALGYRQTEWGFQQQEQQLALQRENFAFQTGMQQRQMQLQRGWTQEDWAYQAEVRGLQWQWRQEDYAEQLRFMTGRDRRLAQRQMGRETTLYELESEQIEKTKDRQKELWAMEDERFAQQVAYQTRIMDMQEQNLNKQRQFFEERKALEAESVELQREYWQKQWDLNMQAAGAAAAYAASQAEIALTMQEFSQTTSEWTSQGNLFDPATMADLATALESIDANFSSFVDDAERLATLMGWEQKATDEETVFETPDDNGDDDDDDGYPMLQHGGRAYPGSSYLVGERGMELFTPDLAGTVRPLDPWGMTISSNVVDSSASVPIHLIVHLGDEILIDRVLNAVDQEIRE